MGTRTLKGICWYQRVFVEASRVINSYGNKSWTLYISTLDLMIGSMLAQEDGDGVERAIYCLSRLLTDAETRYSLIENLCLYLYFLCMKLEI